MRNLLQSLILAGVMVVATNSAVLAKDHPLSAQEQRVQRSADYWDGKNADSNKASGERQMSDAAMMPKASHYPCPHCIYDQQLGGYVQKDYGKK